MEEARLVEAILRNRPAERGYEVYAPHGLDDISTLTIRPNRCPNFRADLYEAKAATWKARWPELTILPPTDSQSRSGARDRYGS